MTVSKENELGAKDILPKQGCPHCQVEPIKQLIMIKKIQMMTMMVMMVMHDNGDIIGIIAFSHDPLDNNDNDNDNVDGDLGFIPTIFLESIPPLGALVFWSTGSDSRFAFISSLVQLFSYYIIVLA